MLRGSRRRGREAALQLLYQLDVTGDPSPAALETFWENLPGKSGSAEVRAFASDLVGRVLDKREELDRMIDEASRHWQLERISSVDLNLMRLATCELLESPEVPARVVVDEAIEIAHRFSDAKSAGFVNGILDHIAREQGRFEEG